MKKSKLNIDAPTGWVGLDRYREAIADIEANMRGEVPEELKGMSMAQIYERLTTVKDKPHEGKAKIYDGNLPNKTSYGFWPATKGQKQ
jgi:hypothetical protein